MTDFIPEGTGRRIGRCCLTDRAEQRIHFLLIGADDNVRADTTLIVLYRKASDRKKLRYIRVRFIFNSDDIYIGLAAIGHRAAVGLNVYDVASRDRQGSGGRTGDIGPFAASVLCPLISSTGDSSRSRIGRGCK